MKVADVKSIPRPERINIEPNAGSESCCIGISQFAALLAASADRGFVLDSAIYWRNEDAKRPGMHSHAKRENEINEITRWRKNGQKTDKASREAWAGI